MSKYNKEKMFFIQTPIKFWYRQDIIWLQNQPDGYQILTLYNKLMGLTANMDGYLLKQFGDVKEPYTNEEIARITMHDLSIVEKGINLLEKVGLLEKIDNAYFIEEALNMTNQTIGANKKQKQRNKKKDKCPPKCLPDCLPYTNTQSNTKQEIYINKNKEKEIDDNTNTNIQLDNKYNDTIKIIIDYLNDKSNKKFTTKNEFANKWIIELLNSNYTIDDFKRVIDNKVDEWNNDPDNRKYLRPGTLFNPSNFSKFLLGNYSEKDNIMFDDVMEDYLHGEESDSKVSF